MQVMLMVDSGSRRGEAVPVTGTRFYIGGAPNCHMVCRGEGISRHHCVIFVDKTGTHIQDLGSTAGTYVNEKRTKRRQTLKSGDHLSVGPFRFQLRIVEDEPARRSTSDMAPPAPGHRADERISHGAGNALQRDLQENVTDERKRQIVGVSRAAQARRVAATTEEAAAEALKKLMSRRR